MPRIERAESFFICYIFFFVDGPKCLSWKKSQSGDRWTRVLTTQRIDDEGLDLTLVDRASRYRLQKVLPLRTCER